MFTVFKKVLEQKEITPQDADKVSDFLLRRWLSGDNRLIELANTLNCLPANPANIVKQSNLVILRGISKALKGQIKFIKFPSGAKKDSKDIEYQDMMSKFFKISPKEAIEYLEWMKSHCPEELETLKVICRDL